MKGILEFNLPEDGDEWRIACDAANLSAALQDLEHEMRSVVKYDHPPDQNIDVGQSDFAASTDYWRRKLREALAFRGVREE